MRRRRDDTDESSTPAAGLDVPQIAAALKLDLTELEMLSFQASLAKNLAILDEFLADNAGANSPAGVPGERRISCPPSSTEDPLNAWLSRCSITGSGDGLLAGMTAFFKDTIAVAGLPLTCGIIGLDDYVPEFDATVVCRALQEGATIVGKNTILGGFGEADLGRRPLNPHSPDHLSGGTSAGSAVAVVSGDVDVAFGGDQGGSIRVPAA